MQVGPNPLFCYFLIITSPALTPGTTDLFSITIVLTFSGVSFWDQLLLVSIMPLLSCCCNPTFLGMSMLCSFSLLRDQILIWVSKWYLYSTSYLGQKPGIILDSSLTWTSNLLADHGGFTFKIHLESDHFLPPPWLSSSSGHHHLLPGLMLPLLPLHPDSLFSTQELEWSF